MESYTFVAMSNTHDRKSLQQEEVMLAFTEKSFMWYRESGHSVLGSSL